MASVPSARPKSRIAASGDSVYVAWQDGRNGGDDLYATASQP